MDPIKGGLQGGQWVPGQLVVRLEDNGAAPYKPPKAPV
jgi:hypothetical protein